MSENAVFFQNNSRTKKKDFLKTWKSEDLIYQSQSYSSVKNYVVDVNHYKIRDDE